MPSKAAMAPHSPMGQADRRYSEWSRQSFLRDTDELVNRLSARIQKNKYDFDDYIFLGRLFRIRGEAKRALRLHRNLLVRPALERGSKAILLAELGYDHFDLEMQDMGVSYFLQALEIQKNNISAMEGLLRAHEAREEYEPAIEILNRLVRLGRPEKTHLAFVQSALAQRYVKERQLAKALRTVERALKNDPSCLFASLTQADVYIEGKRFQKAILALKNILRRWPSHSFLALRRLEDAHYRMGVFTSYEDTLRDCIRSSPENYYLHYSLARHLRKKKKTSDALTALRRTLDIQPQYVNALKDRIELSGDEADMKEIRMLSAKFFDTFKKSRRFICSHCWTQYKDLEWRCASCGTWSIFDIQYELPAP